MTRLVFSTILIVLLALNLGAEDEQNIPRPSGDSWRVGIALLEHDEKDLGAVSVASLFPRIIRSHLLSCDTHVLSAQEQNSLAETALENALVKKLNAVEELYVQSDNLFFSLNSNPVDQKNLNKIIERDQGLLEEFRRLLPVDVEVPESYPVIFPETSNGGDLWNLQGIPPTVFREMAGLDVLVAGKVERLGDYYGVRVETWTHTGSQSLWEGAGDDAELNVMAAEAAGVARRLVLGRPWAALEVAVTPSTALISLDGLFSGVGYWKSEVLKPGPSSVEVTAPGFLPQVTNVVLDPGRTKTLDIVLEEAESSLVSVRSEPSGADLFLGGQWMGRTPLSLLSSELYLPLTLSLEGYKDRIVPLTPDTEVLTVNLDIESEDRSQTLVEARHKLYQSMTWFGFSLAPPLILYGVSMNYAEQYNTATYAYSERQLQSYYDTALQSKKISDNVYYAMWGAIGVSAGFFTHLIFKLVHYLRAVEDAVP